METVLVAGIGNIFHRDDAFGVAVASRMAEIGTPCHVRVIDFGIRGFDLMLALQSGYELAILVDAVARGGRPGTLYVIDPQLDETDASDSPEGIVDNAHGLNPLRVLEMAKHMGSCPTRVRIVGCEPESVDGESGELGLTASVELAVEPAIELILSLVAQSGEAPQDLQQETRVA